MISNWNYPDPIDFSMKLAIMCLIYADVEVLDAMVVNSFICHAHYISSSMHILNHIQNMIWQVQNFKIHVYAAENMR